MTKMLKIDFVSDVSCPWCVIGLRALDVGLARAKDAVEAQITFQPFELNPDMPPAGQNVVEHVRQKYGSTPQQSAAARAAIGDRADQLGFKMAFSDDSRIYNTFDAHRLLHWAELQGRQRKLKELLFEAYFTLGRDPSNHDVLVALAAKAGLEEAAAHEVLASGRYAGEVREAENLWRSRGINAVPAIVINDRYLISGGQPPEVFENALRTIARELGQAS